MQIILTNNMASRVHRLMKCSLCTRLVVYHGDRRLTVCIALSEIMHTASHVHSIVLSNNTHEFYTPPATEISAITQLTLQAIIYFATLRTVTTVTFNDILTGEPYY